jgi:hypothetical protein
VEGLCKYGNEPLGSIKFWGVLEWLPFSRRAQVNEVSSRTVEGQLCCFSLKLPLIASVPSATLQRDAV